MKDVPFNSPAILLYMESLLSDYAGTNSKMLARFQQDPDTLKTLLMWLGSCQCAMYESLGLQPVHNLDLEAKVNPNSEHIDVASLLMTIVFGTIEMMETGCVDPLETPQQIARRALKKALPPDVLDHIDQHGDLPPDDVPPID